MEGEMQYREEIGDDYEATQNDDIYTEGMSAVNTEHWENGLAETLKDIENLPSFEPPNMKKPTVNNLMGIIQQIQMVINAQSTYMQCVPHIAKAVVLTLNTVQTIAKQNEKLLSENEMLKTKISEVSLTQVSMSPGPAVSSASTSSAYQANRKRKHDKIEIGDDDEDRDYPMITPRRIMENPATVNVAEMTAKAYSFISARDKVKTVTDAFTFAKAIKDGGADMANYLVRSYTFVKKYTCLIYN